MYWLIRFFLGVCSAIATWICAHAVLAIVAVYGYDPDQWLAQMIMGASAAPNTADPSKMGVLPPPALRHDVSKSTPPLKEWFLILDQRVPSVDADKIVSLIESQTPIHLDLDGLNITVSANGSNSERLPLWNGVTYAREVGFGRIVKAAARMNIKSSISL
jgi:hypothetical protein